MFNRGVGDRGAFSGEAGQELPYGPLRDGEELGSCPAHVCVAAGTEQRGECDCGKLIQNWADTEVRWV